MNISFFKSLTLIAITACSFTNLAAIAHADDLDHAPEIDIESNGQNDGNNGGDKILSPTKATKTITALEYPADKRAAFLKAQEKSYDGESSHQPVKKQRGLYLRGAIGGALTSRTKFEREDKSQIKRNLGNSFQITGGLGYEFNDIFRLEAEAGYLGGWEIKNLEGDTQNLDGAIFGVNAFADLGTIIGITPYLGVGLGGAKLKDADLRLRFNAQTGFAYKLNENTALEFGYEYSAIMGGDLEINGVNYKQNQLDNHMFKIGTRIKF